MKKMFRKKKLFSLGFVLLVYMTIVTPLLVTYLQKQNEAKIRAEAATVTTTPTKHVQPMHPTSFNITASIQGIGNTMGARDIIINKDPAHKQVHVTLFVYKPPQDLVASGTGILTYEPKQRNYKGVVTLPSENLTNGDYYIQVDSPYRRSNAALQSITLHSSNTISPVTLFAGDIHEDNLVNILDYNTFLDCYKELPTLQECSVEKKIASDLNDDNTISKVDYSLFIREITRNAY